MTIDSIPLIDLSPWTWTDTDPSRSSKYSQEDRLQVVQQVQQACREIGFFAVQNHAVDESVMDAAWTASTDFFDLPMEMKLESQTEDEKIYPYGYVQSERLTLGKELLVSTSNSSSSSSSSGGGKVAVPVAASPALDLPPDWFQDKTDHHMSALRVFNHFAVDRVSENDDDGK
jgi:isopenicillin N synthase-like dioxygenase